MNNEGLRRGLFLTSILLIVSLIILLNGNKSKIREKVIFADGQQTVFALVYIADKKGFFDKEGLQIEYHKFSTGKDALNDVILGNSDLVAVFETPTVRRIYEGVDLGIVGTLHRSTRNTGLIILKDHGVKSVLDLRGKKVAVPKGTNAEIFLYLLLSSNGITPNEITVVDTSFDKIAETLNGGTVAAAATFSPDIAVRKVNNKNISIIYSEIYTELSMLVGTKEYVLLHPTIIKKMLAALIKAEEYAKTHKDESIDIIKDWIPAVDLAEARSAYENSIFTVRLDNTLMTILKREAQFLHVNGDYNTDEPNFRNSVILDYLRVIKPENVTIY